MQIHATPYAMALLTTVVISSILAIYSWKKKGLRGAIPLMILFLASAEWALTYALELSSESLEYIIFWGKIQYFGIVIAPICWILIALEYTNWKNAHSRIIIAALSLIPAITIAMVWTNDLHLLHWRDIEIIHTSSGMTIAEYIYGPWFWVNLGTAYIYMVTGLIVLVRAFFTYPPVYRWQITVLLISAIIPWIGNGLYISDLTPFPHLDLTPFAFAISGLGFAIGLFQLRLLYVSPISIKSIISQFPDGIVLLDPENIIIECNSMVSKIFKTKKESIIGRSFNEIILSRSNLGKTNSKVDLNSETEFSMLHDGTEYHYKSAILQIDQHRDSSSGNWMLIKDITAQKQAEQQYNKTTEISTRQSRHINLITHFSSGLISIQDLQQFLQRTTDLIASEFGYRHVGIYMLDDHTDYAILRASSSESGKQLIKKNHKVLIDDTTILGRSVSRRTIVKNDISNPDFKSTDSNHIIAASQVVLPLIYLDHVIGVIDILSANEQELDQSDIEVLGLFSEYISLKIKNIELSRSHQETPSEIHQHYELTIKDRWSTPYTKSLAAYHFNGVELTEAQPSGRDEFSQDNPEMYSDHEGHYLSIPIRVRNQSVGNILLKRDLNEIAWTQDDFELAASATAQIAIALDNARLMAESQRQALREQTISKITSKFTTTIDIDNILQAALEEFKLLPSVQQVSVHLSSDQERSVE